MKGFVSKFCDVDSIEIPKEMLDVSVDENCAEQAIEKLSLRYASQSTAESVEQGDIVFCKSEKSVYPDERTVLIYTDVILPGAEKASKDVLGKNVGEIFETEIFEKEMQLKIEKIIRKTLAKVDDELIASMGIDAVDSVALYKPYIINKTANQIKTENIKHINNYVISSAVENSEFSYDEDEVMKYAKDEYQKYLEEYGDEESESEEEIIDAIISNLKQYWYAEAFCKEKQIEIDMQSAKEQAKQMVEMMSLMGQEVPSEEEMVQEAVQNEYLRGLFTYIESKTAEKMGG